MPRRAPRGPNRPGLRLAGRAHADAHGRSGRRRGADLAGGWPGAGHVYAKGAERLFVLVQRFAPKLVDRAIAAQMADPRIRDYLDKRYGAAPAPAGHREMSSRQRVR